MNCALSGGEHPGASPLSSDPPPAAAARRVLSATLIVLVVATVACFRGLKQEDFSTDEAMWIYVGQKTWDLVRAGDWSDASWNDADATWGYMNPPVAKYVLGAALAARNAQWAWKAAETPPEEVLVAARIPSAVLGVLGCLAVLGIAWSAFGRTAAVLAAILLAVSPLWISVSRHAMTDVYGVTLGLLAVVAFVPVARELSGARRWKVLVPWVCASGIASGLAVGAKLNAASTPAALGALLLFAFGRELVLAPRTERPRRAGIVLVLGILFAATSTATFIGVNPYLHQDAWSRFSGILAFWREMCEQRAQATAGGGFGRAFHPEQKGVQMLLGKIAFPLKPTSLLLLVPFGTALLAGRARDPGVRSKGRLLGWLLLIPALAAIGPGSKQLMHAWLPWIGLLGAAVALTDRTRTGWPVRGRGGGVALVAFWAAVVTFFVWRMTYLPQTRYYLPLLPVACVASGWGLARLRGDVRRAPSTWPRRLVDVALVTGVLSVLASFPGTDRAVVADIATMDAVLPRILQGVSLVSLAAGILGALVLRAGSALPATGRSSLAD